MKFLCTVRNNGECTSTTTTTNNSQNNANGSNTTTTTPTTTTTTKTFINGVEQPDVVQKQTKQSTKKQVNGIAHNALKSAPLTNGSHSKVVSTTTTTEKQAVHGEKMSDNLKVVASGKSDASATKTAAVSHQTVVRSDGAIVSSGQSARMQTVKYAVEASSVQEKIIR